METQHRGTAMIYKILTMVRYLECFWETTFTTSLYNTSSDDVIEEVIAETPTLITIPETFAFF